MNAQVETHKLESAPMQKPSFDKEKAVLFAPLKEVNVVNNYEYTTTEPARKANYKYFGEYHTASFAANDRTNSIDKWNEHLYDLFPDSLASTYHYYQNGDSCFKENMFASTGFTFDPYSTGFDPFYKWGLLEDEEGVFYGYRLDTLSLYAFYRMNGGYNAASPDILRISITHFPRPKTEGNYLYTDYVTTKYGNANRLSPIYNYVSPTSDKGIGTVMKVENKRVIDYKLSSKDSADVPPGRITFRGIDIPIEGGYALPAGHVMSVVVQYVPGFDYGTKTEINDRTYEFEADTFFYENETFTTDKSDVINFADDILILTHDTCLIKGVDTLFFGNGAVIYYDGDNVDTCLYKNNIFIVGQDTTYSYFDDTLTKLIWNTGLPTPLVGEERYLNTFAFICWDITASDREALWDSRGFNTGFFESQGMRYNNPVDWIDSLSVEHNYYTVVYYLSPVFFMSLSIGDDTVHGPRYGQNFITNYSNELIPNIYPNPAKSQLTIDLNETGTANVTIYNVLGQAIIDETLQNISNSINIADLSSGLYFVKVKQNGKSHTVKISKD